MQTWTEVKAIKTIRLPNADYLSTGLDFNLGWSGFTNPTELNWGFNVLTQAKVTKNTWYILLSWIF